LKSYEGSAVRVNFVIVGAQKSGTTSLAGQLAEHPSVCFCRMKEPNYFSKARDWRAGLGEYHRLYSPRAGQICGEASTMYTWLPQYPGTHARLHQYNPELKLIYIMRQPVERMISHYSMRLVRGQVKGAPEEEVLNDPSYINRSRYAFQLQPYLELFGRENIHLVLFEEYVANQSRVLNGVAEFLGIPVGEFAQSDTRAKNQSVGERHVTAKARRLRSTKLARAILPAVPVSIRKAGLSLFSNRLKEKPPFSAALKGSLWRAVADDVRRVEELLGYRLEAWREGYTD
jgi:hypothetical protein